MILDELAAYAKERVAAARKAIPEDRLRALAQEASSDASRAFRFEKALRKPGMSFICEVKKASPSKGVIAEDFPYVEIAREYEAAGADCVSVLTEPRWFLGSDDIFREIRQAIRLPMLRKDFTVDPYQIYEAKVMGADAVLLICALLPAHVLGQYLSLCDSLGLSALVETHDEAEVQDAVRAGARIIGVNNRNLKDFSVDVSTAARLRKRVPEGTVFVAESGIRTPQDLSLFADADAALIGEALMRSDNKNALLASFREAAGS